MAKNYKINNTTNTLETFFESNNATLTPNSIPLVDI
jgi:hypothetical protein